MRDFYLVQRGSFTENMKPDAVLTGCKGIVSLEKMNSSEFGFGEIPKSFRRIMVDFPYYDVYPTTIKNCEGHELMVFARWDRAYDTVKALKFFTRVMSWELKETSRLEYIERASENLGGTNFWWCIDRPNKNFSPDWMAFFNSHTSRFRKAISNDYNEWWMKMTEEEREVEHNRAMI